MFNEIKELKSLLDEGLITQEDYDKKKAELLSSKEGVCESTQTGRRKPNNSSASKVAAKMTEGLDHVKIPLIVLIAVAAIAFVLGVSNLVTANDKINNYYNSENYSSLNENAYVGGDAYNYIINGTYFTGYAVQGMGYLIISTICGTSALHLFVSAKTKTSRNGKAVDSSIRDGQNSDVASEELTSNGDAETEETDGSL